MKGANHGGMHYSRVVVILAAGDQDTYEGFTVLLLDTYPNGDWCLDWNDTNLDHRRISFVVDDADYAHQVIHGFAKDTGQSVTSFTVSPADHDQFLRAKES
jgi:hypothetical protein